MHILLHTCLNLLAQVLHRLGWRIAHLKHVEISPTIGMNTSLHVEKVYLIHKINFVLII
jgi:hypothetical protein